jgi:DNA-binding transcriptional LysR family regulator
MAIPDLEAWAIFAKVAQTGSFAAAARDFNVANATITKAIQRLENSIGERLIHRTTRRFALTETGRALLTHAAQILLEGEAVEAEARSKTAAPRGLVRVAAPMSFGLRHIAPALPDFYAAYPEVSIDLQLDDRIIDLVASATDVAVRIADLPDSSFTLRRLCPVRRFVVGSPAYFARHGTPMHPTDLKSHACLGYSHLATGETWRFIDSKGREESVRVGGPLTASNADALEATLEAGLGVALQPDFLAWDGLVAGRLVTVLRDWQAPLMTLNLLTPSASPRAPRVAVLLDFLAARFSETTAAWLRRPEL